MILSLVVPVYNVEKYVRKTLCSILEKNEKKDLFEVVIVNDGSKDSSMLIVDEYKQKYSNIKVINQDNKGLSCARNAGILASKGAYVWFVDSDDWLVDGAVDWACDFLLRTKYDVILFKIRHYNELGKIVVGWSNYEIKSTKELKGVDVFLENIPYTPMQEYFIRRSFLLENNLFFYEGIYHEDQEFAPRMLLSTENVALIPEFLYCYLRRSGGSIMSNSSLLLRRKKHILLIIDEIRNLMESCSDERHKRAYIHCIYDLIAGLFNGIPQKEYGKLSQELKLDRYRSFFNDMVKNDDSHGKSFSLKCKKLLFLINPRILTLLKKSI